MSEIEIGQYWVNHKGEVCEVIDRLKNQSSYVMRIIQRAWGRHRLGDVLFMHAENWREWYQPDSTEIWNYIVFASKINELHND